MKILNFGSCNIDYVYKLDHIVMPGETESSIDRQVFAGGKGLNQSIATALAGATVYHAGAIGVDGGELRKILNKNGVDTTYLKECDTSTGHAIIQVADSGENSIVIYPGANACIDKNYIDFVLENFSAGDTVIVQNESSNVEYIVDKAYERGLTVVLNPSPINEKIKKIDVNKISYLVLNETEGQAITGKENASDILEFFKTNYPNVKVVLTLGKKGSVYQFGNDKNFQPSFKAKAVDTTAAGDTFMGYFVANVIKNGDVVNAMSLASCASAIAVSKQGASTSIPRHEEVEEIIKTMPLSDNKL